VFRTQQGIEGCVCNRAMRLAAEEGELCRRVLEALRKNLCSVRRVAPAWRVNDYGHGLSLCEMLEEVRGRAQSRLTAKQELSSNR